MNRREWIQNAVAASGALAAGSPFSALAGALAARPGRSVIMLLLRGGPSQLDMYDMKPRAPAEIRGEFRPITTNVVGMQVCEQMPLQATIADKFALVHGVQMVDTHNSRNLIRGIANSTRCVFQPHNTAGHWPAELLKALTRAERGVSSIVSLSAGSDGGREFDWDMHGCAFPGRRSIFAELRAALPAYDRAIYLLLTALCERGLDDDVLVVAWGEFGRAPWINEYGGRNHWAPSSSALFAGGGLRTGQSIGDTGPIGERARDHSYTAQNVMATVYRHLGFDAAALLDDARPIGELI